MKNKNDNPSKCNRVIAFILALIGFIGIAGIHRFYVGKIWTGLIWLFTGGLFLIGTIVDIVVIAQGNFTDKQGRVLESKTVKL